MEKIDTGTEHLIFEKENGVAVLTMNRPEARNAMSIWCSKFCKKMRDERSDASYAVSDMNMRKWNLILP